MTTDRRWNGWGSPGVHAALPSRAGHMLVDLIGPGTPPRDATLEQVLATVPASRIAPEAGLSLDAADRVHHAHGQDILDWIAVRSGRLPAVPDAVARPSDAAAARHLFERATVAGWTLVPFGGGTSVVGGVTAQPSERPVVSVDMGATAGLRALDATSGLATFGAGTVGPDLETALRPSGRMLGHFPQSFEYSTVGGWVVTRSAGQQSMGFGRIEALFAGGHMETPVGPLALPTFPATAAGPDLREIVLGSEGRFGILTDVTVRTVPRPARDLVRAYSVPDWDRALAVGQALVSSGLPLTMVRVSTALETATTLAMVRDERQRRLLRGYLDWRRQGPEACLVLVGLAGSDGLIRAVEGEVARLVKAQRGVGVPGVGRAWQRERFAAPYLRNALWEAGYAVDTLETATDWARLPGLAAALGPVLRRGLESVGERVHAYSHLSHLYPSGSSLYVTSIFRLADDPDETRSRWQRLKRLASETIVEHGGTISHQHGIGRVHAPYLAGEKGPVGMGTLRALRDRFDPAGIMARGVLLEDDST